MEKQDKHIDTAVNKKHMWDPIVGSGKNQGVPNCEASLPADCPWFVSGRALMRVLD